MPKPGSVFTHQIDNIRLGEFDLGGVLYHANYFHLLESAREAWLAKHGAPYAEFAAAKQHLAIVESHQRFLLPIHYGTPCAVTLWTAELNRSSVLVNYEISAGKTPGTTTKVHEAWTRLVYVAEQGGAFKVGRLPDSLSAVFIHYLANSD